MFYYNVVIHRNNNIVAILKANDYYNIYDTMMDLTNDHEKSEDAASWIHLANVDETYEVDNITITFMEYERRSDYEIHLN